MTKNNNIDEKTLNKGKVIRDFEEEFNNKRLSPLSSNTFSNIIKNLSTPRFLGSYHLKEAINPKFKSIEKLLRGDIQLKYTKSTVFMDNFSLHRKKTGAISRKFPSFSAYQSLQQRD